MTPGSEASAVVHSTDELHHGVLAGIRPTSAPPVRAHELLPAAIEIQEIGRAAVAGHVRAVRGDLSPDLVPQVRIGLRELDLQSWRPQDCDRIDTITNQINSWCEQITTLLNPTPKWTLPNPCPACGTAIVYRKNSASETVRQPALQIGPMGCACQHCHHTWEPAYFQHLARVMGYELPPGVLE